MSTVKAAATALEAVIGTVPELRAYRVGDVVDPPGAIVGPPALTWSTGLDTPTDATFPIFVVTSAGDRELERLWDLAEAVGAVLDDVGTVTRAVPGAYNSAGVELPCYEITVEMEL